jgi:hypothetical protein
VRAPFPCCTPIGRLGVIYDSQLAGIHKNTPLTGGSSHILIEKLPKTTFLDKNLTRYNSNTFFERNRFRIKIFLLHVILTCIDSKFRES